MILPQCPADPPHGGDFRRTQSKREHAQAHTELLCMHSTLRLCVLFGTTANVLARWIEVLGCNRDGRDQDRAGCPQTMIKGGASEMDLPSI